MNINRRYPEKVDADDQFTPDLLVLWEEAMNDLRKRSNRALVWQAPVFIIIIIMILRSGEDIVMFRLLLFFAILGMFSQAMRPNYDYVVSHDGSSAEFKLNHIYRLKYLFELPIRIISKAKEGFGGLLLAVASIIFLPIWWGAYSVVASFSFLNNLWWRKWFNTWTESLKKSVHAESGRQHLRGTNILPSVELSGASPDALPPVPLVIAKGNVTLLPDGGIVIQDGATFDRNSTFVNFSVNGLTLTRETQEMLKVSQAGSIHSFRFDGSSWKEI